MNQVFLTFSDSLRILKFSAIKYPAASGPPKCPAGTSFTSWISFQRTSIVTCYSLARS